MNGTDIKIVGFGYTASLGKELRADSTYANVPDGETISVTLQVSDGETTIQRVLVFPPTQELLAIMAYISQLVSLLDLSKMAPDWLAEHFEKPKVKKRGTQKP